MGSEGPDTDFRAFSLNNRYLVFWQRESEKFKVQTVSLFFFYSQSAFYAFSFFHSSNGTCCSLTRFFTSLLLQRTFSHIQPFLCFIASILFRCHVWISCLDAQANQLWQADSLICNADGGGQTKNRWNMTLAASTHGANFWATQHCFTERSSFFKRLKMTF